jgi:hypothetical protein
MTFRRKQCEGFLESLRDPGLGLALDFISPIPRPCFADPSALPRTDPKSDSPGGFDLTPRIADGYTLSIDNLVRILSRVAEGRALRRHSNRFAVKANAGANSCPACFRTLLRKDADGTDKMVGGLR